MLVELVDEAGNPKGTMEKLAAHQAPGHLHRAFSAFLLDANDRLIFQKRADSKYHSAGLWTNTCCGHPQPGEDSVNAARRRVREELGLEAVDWELAGQTAYRLTDPISGLVEHERNNTYIGRTYDDPVLDSDEVAEWQSIPLADVDEFMAREAMTVWFESVFAIARRPLERLAGLT